MCFPDGLDGKESDCNVGDLGLIPGSGRSPGEGNGNPLQYSCLENPMERWAWRATVHRISESDMTERLTFSLSMGIQWYFIVVLIYISQMTNDVEYLFLCMLAILMSSVKWMFTFCPFSYWFVKVLYLIRIQVLCNMCGEGASLVAQWSRICLPMQETPVQSPDLGRLPLPQSN